MKKIVDLIHNHKNQQNDYTLKLLDALYNEDEERDRPGQANNFYSNINIKNIRDYIEKGANVNGVKKVLEWSCVKNRTSSYEHEILYRYTQLYGQNYVQGKNIKSIAKKTKAVAIKKPYIGHNPRPISALVLAARANRLDIVKLLIEKGAVLNKETFYHDYLHFNRHGKQIAATLDTMIDIVFIDRNIALLHLLLASGNLKINQQISDTELRSNFNFDALFIRKLQYKTLLIKAVESGYVALVQYLINENANINAKSSGNYSALDIINHRYYSNYTFFRYEIIQLLQAAIIKQNFDMIALFYLGWKDPRSILSSLPRELLITIAAHAIEPDKQNDNLKIFDNRYKEISLFFDQYTGRKIINNPSLREWFSGTRTRVNHP